jgi:hypothetical protein
MRGCWVRNEIFLGYDQLWGWGGWGGLKLEIVRLQIVSGGSTSGSGP